MKNSRRNAYRTARAGRKLFSRCGRAIIITFFLWGVWQVGVLAGRLSLRFSGQTAGRVPGQIPGVAVEQAVRQVSTQLQGWRQDLTALLHLFDPFSGPGGAGDSDTAYAQEILRQQMEEENWEELLLAEQQASSQVNLQTGQEAGTSLSESDYDLFPEDLEGEEVCDDGWFEPDADLQAEIQEEYFLAEQQAALAQNAETEEGPNGAAAGEEPDAVTEPGLAGDWTLPYTMEQLHDLEFLRTYIYNVNRSTTVDTDLLDADAMLDADMSLAGDLSEGPKILIHHTHATEYFIDSDPEDESTLIVGVGDYLAEILETTYGIQVVHDRTVYPYNEAYSQALTHEEELLAAYPTIEVMIDLHRDSAGNGKYTAEVDGKSMANLMFFNGLSRNANGEIAYLPNPNLADNLAFSFQLKMVGDSLYPGLCKRNYLKSYRYNLHVLPKAVIVEVGDNHNTLQEAKNAMEPLARILYTVLMGKQQG